jgi:two-component system, LytTR family, response regulator AlgR
MRTHITANYRRSVVRIPIADITHFTSADKYVTAHHPGGELVIEDKMKNLEAELSREFIRTHRRAMVRRSLVCEYTAIDSKTGVVRLQGLDSTLPVSLSRISAVKALFAQE